MILNIFSIYDSKIESYMKPFYCNTKGEAIRMFSDGLKESDSLISKHPEDFTLFHLGEYDDSTAKFTPLETPHSLGVGIEFAS